MSVKEKNPNPIVRLMVWLLRPVVIEILHETNIDPRQMRLLQRDGLHSRKGKKGIMPSILQYGDVVLSSCQLTSRRKRG